MSTETQEQAREALERIRRLVLAATGNDSGDGTTVTDYGIGISEPGYETKKLGY